MSDRARPSRWGGPLAAALALVLAAGCAEVESSSSGGYEPAHLEPAGDATVVTFTEEGARRTGLRTARVEQRGGTRSVPYTALLYDGSGDSHVYTSPKPLTYVRAAVSVRRVAGDRVLLKDGPPAGTRVVTVGATEVYGTELEIAGSH